MTAPRVRRPAAGRRLVNRALGATEAPGHTMTVHCWAAHMTTRRHLEAQARVIANTGPVKDRDKLDDRTHDDRKRDEAGPDDHWHKPDCPCIPCQVERQWEREDAEAELLEDGNGT